MKLAFALLAASLLVGGAADAASRSNEAKIRFLQHGGIRDWRTDNDRELFIQDASRLWYRAELSWPCTGLAFASGVKFLPSDGAGTFDRFSYIIANGERCKVQSLTRLPSEPNVRNHPSPRS